VPHKKIEEPLLIEECADTERLAPHPEPDGWARIETAPRDGTLIEYRGAGDIAAVHYARFRITRERDHEARRWKVVGYWADPVTREKVLVEPMIWRMPEGYLQPGMVV
jgi:hypothetical protein